MIGRLITGTNVALLEI